MKPYPLYELIVNHNGSTVLGGVGDDERSEGNAIFSFVSEYAKFKDHFLPTSAVAVRGILYRRVVSREIGDQFVIIPRTKDDFTTANSDL